MTLPNNNLKLSQALNEFDLSAPGTMSQLSGRKAAPYTVPQTPYWLGDLFGMTAQIEQTIRISSNTTDWRLSNQGLNSNLSYDLTIIVESGVVVGSSSTGNYAMYLDQDLLDNSTVTLINNGYIVGRGGNGGTGDTAGGPSSVGGNDGGPALGIFGSTAGYTLRIDNSNGIIGGGGGGGAGGASLEAAGGGGGAGYPAGSGGDGQPADGSNGSTTSGGAGGTAEFTYGCSGGDKLNPCSNTATAETRGGDGGNLGQNGQSSNIVRTSGFSNPNCCTAGEPTGDEDPGGSGGNAINGSSRVDVWISQGDIRGTIS